MTVPLEESPAKNYTGNFWKPVSEALTAENYAAFRHDSLPRESQQVNLLLSAFAVFSLVNFAIDWSHGSIQMMTLNGFLFAVAIGVIYYIKKISVYRILDRATHIFTIMIIGALLGAKMTIDVGNWFIYFADILVITSITLALPTSSLSKAGYAATIILVDAIQLSQAPFPIETSMGVILILVIATIFAQIVYYKMQQAHLTSFLSLQREVAINEDLLNARNRIDTLQDLLPICAKCKNVRDDNGYWEQIEEYIDSHLHVNITHGICPDCFAELYPGMKPKEP